MDDSDISDAAWWERVDHHLTNMAGKINPEHTDYQRRVITRKRVEALPAAMQQATGEMLDEIHYMLRKLTGISGKI